MIQLLYRLDISLLLWIQRTFVNNSVTDFVIAINRLGNFDMVWILISALLFVRKKTKNIGLLCFVALICSFLINTMLLKNLIGRISPYNAISLVKLLIKAQGSYSFPSEHASSSFSVVAILFKKLPKKYGIVSLAFALIIAISSLYLGLQYPSDVLMGILIGSFIGYIIVKLDSQIQEIKRDI